MQDIFAFDNQGLHGDKVMGELKPTGIRPSFADRLAARGLDLPTGWFGYRE